MFLGVLLSPKPWIFHMLQRRYKHIIAIQLLTKSWWLSENIKLISYGFIFIHCAFFNGVHVLIESNVFFQNRFHFSFVKHPLHCLVLIFIQKISWYKIKTLFFNKELLDTIFAGNTVLFAIIAYECLKTKTQSKNRKWSTLFLLFDWIVENGEDLGGPWFYSSSSSGI